MGKEYTRPIIVTGLLPFSDRIIYHDDFEGILKWPDEGSLGDYIYELDPSVSLHGNQSLYLKTRTAGAIAGDNVFAARYDHLRPSKVHNFITNLRSPDWTKMLSCEIYLSYSDGNIGTVAAIKLRPNIPDIQYYTTGQDYASIPDSEYRLYNNSFHQINLKINFATYKYLSLTVDHRFFDLSALTFFSTPALGFGYLKTKIWITTAGAAPAELYIGTTILHEI